MAQISQELRDKIRNRVITKDEDALWMLELYIMVDKWFKRLVVSLREYSDTDPSDNGNLRDKLRDVHSIMRLKMDLQRELRTISRPYRTEYEEGQEEDQEGESKRVTPKASSATRKPAARNRQHRKRVSKRHNEVSSESSTHS
jgi:hypothetical protein